MGINYKNYDTPYGRHCLELIKEQGERVRSKTKIARRISKEYNTTIIL